jgi:hypothetical protein
MLWKTPGNEPVVTKAWYPDQFDPGGRLITLQKGNEHEYDEFLAQDTDKEKRCAYTQNGICA